MNMFLTVFAFLMLMPVVPSADEFVVKIKFDEDTGRVYYEPASLKIKFGDTVTWIQDDAVNEHNIVSYPDGIPKGTALFESPMMRRVGERWSRKFNKSGTYYYHCHPHEALGMRARIIVDRESLATEIRHAKAGEHMHGGGMHAINVSGHRSKLKKGGYRSRGKRRVKRRGRKLRVRVSRRR